MLLAYRRSSQICAGIDFCKTTLQTLSTTSWCSGSTRCCGPSSSAASKRRSPLASLYRACRGLFSHLLICFRANREPLEQKKKCQNLALIVLNVPPSLDSARLFSSRCCFTFCKPRFPPQVSLMFLSFSLSPAGLHHVPLSVLLMSPACLPLSPAGGNTAAQQARARARRIICWSASERTRNHWNKKKNARILP